MYGTQHSHSSQNRSALGAPCVAAILAAALSMGASDAQAAATFYGPTAYLSFADSPFKALALKQFYLETFEDGALNTPGVTITNNKPGGAPLGVITPSAGTDSVDADDGAIDGDGRRGHTYSSLSNEGFGSYGMTVTFSASVLGKLPTVAGLVWTDGSQTASTLFEAFDADGNSLGTIGPVKIGDTSFFGTTGEDRFFGVSNAGGISKITIRDPGSFNALEIDHLQYGLAVPEPTTYALLLAGMGVIGALRRRRGD